MKNWMILIVVLLVLASCKKETRECPGAGEKTLSIIAYNKITAGGTFNISIEKGNDFFIKAKGCLSDLNELEFNVTGDGNLNIDFSNNRSNRYRVDLFITMPELAQINLSGAARSTISGFNGQNAVMSHILSGTSACSVNGAAINAHVDLSGTAVLSINGYTENLYGTISGASKLETYALTAYEVDLSASGTARAYVKPDVRFYAEASGASRIFYKGNPQIKHVQTSGAGQVIQE